MTRDFWAEEEEGSVGVMLAVGADMWVLCVSDGKETKEAGAVCWLVGLLLGRAVACALRGKGWAGPSSLGLASSPSFFV